MTPARAIAALGVAVVITCAGAIWAAATAGPENPTFDCGRTEVGVWVDYDERKMECVGATDHAAHNGDDHG